MATNSGAIIVPAANERRTADFHPTVWGDFFLTRVFNTQETVDGWNREIEVLKQDVKVMLTTSSGKLSENLKLIDVVERLGIGYHFEDEIEEHLEHVYNGVDNVNDDLSTVALLFRLLRQHGYSVTSDIFNEFKNEEGGFKKELASDVEGMLSMYEAAYLRKHGEAVLDQAIEFTTVHLTSFVGNAGDEQVLLGERVARALRRPLRKGVEKHEQLFFISNYEKEESHNHGMLKLAKLSWNVLQHLYQQELRDITKWWIDLDFATKLSFARDRLIEVYFWAVGAMWEPKFSMARYILSKITMLVSINDDIYDVHGTIDELELLTATVERWDTSMKDLPEYMRLFYGAIIGVVDEIDSITSKEGRPFCADYGKQAEKNQMRAYLTEARWFARGEVPTIQEYRRVGVYSCTYPLLAYSALAGLGDKAPKEAFDWLMADPKILVAVSDHCRLMDDIVSHEFEQERGHVASAVECYMKQYDVSRLEAVDVLNQFLEDDWKDINEDCLNSPSFISKEVLSMFVGLAKVMEVLYKEFDSYTFSNTVTRDMMTALLVTPMIMANAGETTTAANERRTADFHPTVWGDFFITRTFNTQETVDEWNQDIEVLIEDVKVMLTTSAGKVSEKLKLIDVVERLGIGYHFEAEIEEQLEHVYNGGDNVHDDLSTVALQFRLLRQHGYSVTSDIFNKFKNEEGSFKKEQANDVQGMLSMYEAAYLRKRGETVLDEAIEFTTVHLTNSIANVVGDAGDEQVLLRERVARALRRPLRKGVEKHEQLFFISNYEKEESHNQVMLKLAKLSWNVLQHMYQQELRDLTKWWIDLDFATKLSFARDRLIEVYFWAVGAMWEPKFSLARYMITKITCLVSIADDIYDVHGTIDELELLTATVERWDTSMKDLPEYMRLFYGALIDFVDEIDSITSKQGRPFCADYGKRAEKNQMRAYLAEARWFAKGKVPTIQEYRRLGVYSCTYPLLTYSALCGLGDKAPKEAFEWLVADPKILVAISDHCRLMDDIVSHEFEQERGHVASAVECYMKQYGVSRKEAVEVLNQFLEDDWKDINEGCLNSPGFISKEVLSMFVGLAKVMEVLYKEFDSYTFSNTVTRDMMTALLVTPMV
ncbi:Probable terpene synthase 3 [Linum grandiflorum]